MSRDPIPPGWAGDLALMVGAFAAAAVVAGLAGAENLGTALSFGVLAFALALIWTLLRR